MFIKLEIDDINSNGSLPKLIQFSGKEYFIIGQLLFKDTAMNKRWSRGLIIRPKDEKLIACIGSMCCVEGIIKS